MVESGIPEHAARVIMKGIHPQGTCRPDNPDLCALRTGEVRLLDRSQRYLPWVFQNRTLDWRSPGPPVQGLGVRNPDGGTGPRLVDWELEEARRRGELPNLFDEPEEFQADPTDSPRSQVRAEEASSSGERLRRPHAAEAAVHDYMYEMYVNQMWDGDVEDNCWPPAASSHDATGLTCEWAATEGVNSSSSLTPFQPDQEACVGLPFVTEPGLPGSCYEDFFPEEFSSRSDGFTNVAGHI